MQWRHTCRKRVTLCSLDSGLLADSCDGRQTGRDPLCCEEQACPSTPSCCTDTPHTAHNIKVETAVHGPASCLCEELPLDSSPSVVARSSVDRKELHKKKKLLNNVQPGQRGTSGRLGHSGAVLVGTTVQQQFLHHDIFSSFFCRWNGVAPTTGMYTNTFFFFEYEFPPQVIASILRPPPCAATVSAFRCFVWYVSRLASALVRTISRQLARPRTLWRTCFTLGLYAS